MAAKVDTFASVHAHAHALLQQSTAAALIAAMLGSSHQREISLSEIGQVEALGALGVTQFPISTNAFKASQPWSDTQVGRFFVSTC